MAAEEARAQVRALIWDPPVWVLDEAVGIGDGRRTTFELSGHPVTEDSLLVWVNGEDVSDDVEFEAIYGLITFDEAVAEGLSISANYAWSQLSDIAIDTQLDAVNGNVDLAAARCLEVLALDPAAVLALRLDGVGADLTARRATIAEAIRTLRSRGGYAQFQHRVDAIDWGDV